MVQGNETFYFCDLKTHDTKCPKSETCKRWIAIKDVDYSIYPEIGVAKLYNICKESNNYMMYLEDRESASEVDNNA